MYGVNNVFFSGMNRINSLRLNQALFGNQIKGPSDFSSVGKHRYTQKKHLSASEKAFLKDYKDEMKGIMTASEKFNQSSSSTIRTASSDNTLVASASGRTDLSTDKYTVDVKNTAKAQINTSSAISSSKLDGFKGGELIIEDSNGRHAFHTPVFNMEIGRAHV